MLPYFIFGLIYRVCPNRRAMRECGHWGAPLFISNVVVLNNSREYGNIHMGLFTPVLEMHCVLRVARYIDMTDIAYCLAPRYIVSRKFIRYCHIETVSFLSLCVWFYDRIGSPYIIMRCSRSIFSKRFTHAYVCMLNHYISIRSFKTS